AWAQLEAGLKPQPVKPMFLRRMLTGVPIEVAAVELLAAGEPQRAAALFAEAATHWAPYHRRGDFRCRWAQGEALRRAGDDAAVAVLEAVEADALALQHHMIVGRIRRSLRQLGVRRSADRSAHH